jgi:hypothetical protein
MTQRTIRLNKADFGAFRPNYFDVLRIPLKKRRVFTDHNDDTANKVVVVNETFARKFFRRETPSDGACATTRAEQPRNPKLSASGDVRNQSQLGIYGVMAFVVSQSVQEFEIRMALGARSRDIVLLAIRPGLRLVWVGVTVGVILSMFVTRLMASLLFGVSAIDPFTFVVVPSLLGIVALIACLFPARHALRISPAQALRC